MFSEMKANQKYEEAVTRYVTRTSKSQVAYERARQFLTGGETRSVSYYNPYPLTIAKGKGCMIYDLDGNEYIDFISNYTSLIHGHAHPEITKAINKAAELGTAVPAGIEEQVELAEMICSRMKTVESVRFCNSGTEATMFAVRIARAYTGKDGIIKMLGGYHGTTDIMEFSISPEVDPNNLSVLSYPIPESAGIPRNAGKDVFIATFNDLKSVDDILKQHSDEIACIIVEPFLGAGGMIIAKPGFLKGLRELADKYGVLLILDEVQSFRLSTGGAQKKYQVDADITALGKVIGGGLPVGAVGGKRKFMNLFDPKIKGHLSQSGTFNGNRVTMSAGIKSLQMLDDACINKLEKLAEKLEEGFISSIKNNNVSMCVTRDGSLLNVHFLKNVPTDYVSSITKNEIALKLWHLEMMEKGIFPAPRGLFVISSVMEESVIDKTIKAFDNSIRAVLPYIT